MADRGRGASDAGGWRKLRRGKKRGGWRIVLFVLGGCALATFACVGLSILLLVRAPALLGVVDPLQVTDADREVLYTSADLALDLPGVEESAWGEHVKKGWLGEALVLRYERDDDFVYLASSVRLESDEAAARSAFEDWELESPVGVNDVPLGAELDYVSREGALSWGDGARLVEIRYGERVEGYHAVGRAGRHVVALKMTGVRFADPAELAALVSGAFERLGSWAPAEDER